MPAQLNNQDFQMKYHFEALFDDGEVFVQNAADKSEIDEKRSAFYDLLQKNKPMRSFGIFGEHVLVVDLHDGHFELDGIPIIPSVLPPGPIPLKLVFYRQHQHDMSMTYEIDRDLQPQLQKSEETGHRITYFVGWECEFSGKKYKQVLGLI